MLAAHLATLSKGARAGLRLGAGLVLIAGLLLGIAVVAGGEVRKAQTRDARFAAQQAAVSQCMETLRGRALNTCVQQARADADAAPAATTLAVTTTVADSDAAGVVPPVDGATLPSSRSGIMSIAFGAHPRGLSKN
jgi:hypothetical protein